MSVSYLPKSGEDYDKLVADFDNLYQRFKNEKGFVYMTYCTSLHLGEIN